MREYAERDYDAEISGIENQIRSNQDYYEKLGQQIGELSRDKELYDEGEWNSLYDEKAGAQSDAVNKIYELRGQLNDLQAERDGQSTVSQDDAADAPSDEEIPETLDDGDYLDDEYLEENEQETDNDVNALDDGVDNDTESNESSEFDSSFDSLDDSDNSADVAESIKEDVTNDTDEPKE